MPIDAQGGIKTANHKRKARLEAAAAARAAAVARRPEVAAELAALLHRGAVQLTADGAPVSLARRLEQQLREFSDRYGPVSVAASNWRLSASDALRQSRSAREAGAKWRSLAREAAAWSPAVEASAPRGTGYAYGHPLHPDQEDEH